MSLVLTPDAPLDAWVAQLDEQIARSPKVFEGRPVLLDVSLLAGLQAELVGLVAALAARGIRVIGIDGCMPHALGPWAAQLDTSINRRPGAVGSRDGSRSGLYRADTG